MFCYSICVVLSFFTVDSFNVYYTCNVYTPNVLFFASNIFFLQEKMKFSNIKVHHSEMVLTRGHNMWFFFLEKCSTLFLKYPDYPFIPGALIFAKTDQG